MRLAVLALVSVLVLPLGSGRGLAQGSSAQTGQSNTSVAVPDRSHDTAEWVNVAAHLPDPATASPGVLEAAADVLRARRYDVDALRFYQAALNRGGDPVVLLKKMGVICLQMQQIELARAYFQRALRLKKRDPGAWNNLGATEFVLGNNRAAVRDYKRASKLDGSSAVYHSNLALAYFEEKHAESARRELRKALLLDPELLHRSGQDGYIAQVLASQNYPEICFEMARIYASQGQIEPMLDWLTKASDRGYDVRRAMREDAALRPLLADPRVQLILKNTQTLRAATKAPGKVPSLGAAPQP